MWNYSQFHTLWVWGSNVDGQVGNGTTGRCFKPEQVLSEVVAACASGWHMLAMTFDGIAIRAFVNGSLDARPPDAPHRSPNFTQCNERWQNPAPISTWTDASPGAWGPGGAPLSKNKTDFTVGGQRAEPCPDGVPCTEGMGHPWSGLVGGLAVYDRALDGAELLAMARQTGMTPLTQQVA